MILQIRTETFYAVEMTEKQIQELSLVFNGLQEKDVDGAITRMKSSRVMTQDLAARKHIHETVKTFRLAIGEHNKI